LNIQSRDLYVAVIEKFTGCIIPLAGILLVLVATVSSGTYFHLTQMLTFKIEM
jgi:hypothetical protein